VTSTAPSVAGVNMGATAPFRNSTNASVTGFCDTASLRRATRVCVLPAVLVAGSGTR
jgi:hypothetical protein